MSESVINLVNAIKSGDAIATEQSFADAMAEKIGAKIEDMRASIASNMFAVAEESVEEACKSDKKKKMVSEEDEIIELTQEEWEALSEEEQAEYEVLDEASKKSLGGRAADMSHHLANTTLDSGASRKDMAVGKKQVRKLKKSIAASHGKDTAERAFKSADDDFGNQYSSMGSANSNKKSFIKKDLGGKKSKEYKTYDNRMKKSGMHDEE